MARAFRPGFLARRNHQGQATLQVASIGDVYCRAYEGRYPGLHVRRATPIQPPTADLASKRRNRPRLLAQRNGVQMTREDKRSPARLGARKTRNEVCARRLVLVALEDEPMRLKHAREVFCAGFLSPGWVHSLEPDQLLGKRNGIDAH